MTIDEMIEVLQASKDGKQIQFQFRGSNNLWYDATEPEWEFTRRRYRVKPESREWILELKSFKVIQGPADGIDEVVRVREVLP